MDDFRFRNNWFHSIRKTRENCLKPAQDLHNRCIIDRFPFRQDFILFNETKSGKIARALQMNDFYFVKSHYKTDCYQTRVTSFNKFLWNEKWLMKLYLAHEPTDLTINSETTNWNFHYVFDQIDQVRSLTILSCLYVVFCCFRQKKI